jgi:hypothetical protein
MIRALAAAALLLLAHTSLSPAFAQQHARPDEDELPLLYGSGGLAWSGELGLELEFGVQTEIAPWLQFRFSPLNLSLFDGDTRSEYGYDDPAYDDFCEDDYDEGWPNFCFTEPDSEWRSVAEFQLKLGDMRLGAGAAYILQGDFTPADGRVATFLTFGAKVDEESAIELRAGNEYISLRVAGLW